MSPGHDEDEMTYDEDTGIADASEVQWSTLQARKDIDEIA